MIIKDILSTKNNNNAYFWVFSQLNFYIMHLHEACICIGHVSSIY